MGAVVLAIDRQEVRAVAAHSVHDQGAAGDQNLFIRKSDAFAETNGFVGGFQADDADDSGDHGIDLRSADSCEEGWGAAAQRRPIRAGDSRAGQAGGELREGGLIGHGGEGWRNSWIWETRASTFCPATREYT